MRHLFLLLFLFSISFQAYSKIQFKLPHENLHYRIDVNDGTIWKERISQNWIEVGKIVCDGIVTSDLPPNAVINSFLIDRNYILTIPGTGQVYQLNQIKNQFKRLDKTFYRGFNFGAIQFARNDTLYSLGGNGFWHANNIETYFSFKSKEWELKNIPSELGPRFIKSDFGGFDAKRDVLSIIEFPALYHEGDISHPYRYFEKSFKSNQWDYKGDINIDLLVKLGLTNFESIFLNGKYIFTKGPFVVIADPVQNEIYQLNYVLSNLNFYYELSERNNWLYIYVPDKNENNVFPAIKIDSISIDKLKSLSTYKGPFYIKPYPTDLIGYGVAAMLILTAGGIYAYRRSKLRKAPESSIEPLDGLPAGAFEFLHACLKHPQGHAFSSQHFTEMMGYDSYAYETQRQVRAKLIKGINSYFWAHYRMDDVIIRQTANDDKRFSVYLIAESHYDTLKKLLNV
ncbi:hypothetical protein VR610_10330 [Aquirufa regiilacus]